MLLVGIIINDVSGVMNGGRGDDLMPNIDYYGDECKLTPILNAKT